MGVPVTVVSGFLGAGKTTLVNRWLAQAARDDIAVIVNEHGAIGVDAELLAARTRKIVEITGGCVCCATQAELVRALDGLTAAPAPPKRVLVETSGAASPAGVLRAISRGEAFALDGVITVVDATRVDALATHDLALEQIGYADVVVLSRVDACDRRQVAHALSALAARNGAATFVEAAHGALVAPPRISLDELLASRRGDLPLRTPPPAQSSHVYESVALSLDGEIDGERFAEFVESELGRIAGRIFRTKAIVAVAGLSARMIVQGVADAVEISFGEPWREEPRRSRLVVVGFGLDRAALTQGFAACRRI